MKKLILLIFILFLCTGCSFNRTYSALDYFPFLENTLLEYEGQGHAAASQQHFAGYVRDNVMQRRNTSDFPSQVELFEYKNGTISWVYGNISVYYLKVSFWAFPILLLTEKPKMPKSQECRLNLI